MSDTRSLGRPGASSEAEAAVQREYVTQLREIPLLDGQLVTATIPAGGLYVRVNHSLGRPYTGGILVNADSYADTIFAQEPRAAAISPFKVKPEKELIVFTGTAVTFDTLFSMWIFAASLCLLVGGSSIV